MSSPNSANTTREAASADGCTRVQFLDWTVDLVSGELFHNGERVRIQEKPFQILAILLQRPGQLVTRQELCASVWSESDSDAEAGLNTAIRKLRQSLGDTPRHPRLIETVGSSGYRLLVEPKPVLSPQPGDSIRIAVLPFQNLSTAEHDYFADWLTEQMIVQLADPHSNIKVVIPVLKPAHRGDSSIESLAERNIDADYFLCGSMIKTNDHVRVSVKLLRDENRECVWSETYSRQVSDPFRVQDALTLQVACSILQVIPGAISAEHGTSPSAYGKALKASHFARQWSEPSFWRAIGFLEHAIKEDPEFARAHAALARTHASMMHYGILQPSVNVERLRQEASIALELCPDLPDAIVALGCAHFFYEADWIAAERSFQRALQISPGSAYAYQSYARLLCAIGRRDDSIRAALHSRELMPTSPYPYAALANAYYFARRFEEAIKPCIECIEMEPNFSVIRAILGQIYEAMGHYDDAVASYRDALACAPDGAVLMANLAHGLGVAGQKDEARSLLDRILAIRATAYVPGYWIAAIYMGLGEVENGLEWLRTAVDERCGWRVLIAVDPKLDAHRHNAEFVAILKRIGFPQVVASPFAQN